MGNLQSNKVILFLSGGFQQTFAIYLQKMLTDLLAIDYIRITYQLIVFEKPDKQSFVCAPDLRNYINSLNDQIKINELILFGFSSGGVIASHSLSLLKDIKCKKKIITYDTPYQVLNNVLSYEKTNLVFRPDIFFYYVIKKTYINHYNYDEIKQFIKHDYWTDGAAEFLQMIFKIHNLTEDEFYKLSGFNFDQDNDTKVIEIYCENDPIVNREISNTYIKNNKSLETNIISDCKKSIGHCSDMWSPNFDIISIVNHIRS
jgi:predicted esterase